MAFCFIFSMPFIGVKLTFYSLLVQANKRFHYEGKCAGVNCWGPNQETEGRDLDGGEGA